MVHISYVSPILHHGGVVAVVLHHGGVLELMQPYVELLRTVANEVANMAM